jgi:hypothetical protein
VQNPASSLHASAPVAPSPPASPPVWLSSPASLPVVGPSSEPSGRGPFGDDVSLPAPSLACCPSWLASADGAVASGKVPSLPAASAPAPASVSPTLISPSNETHPVSAAAAAATSATTARLAPCGLLGPPEVTPCD